MTTLQEQLRATWDLFKHDDAILEVRALLKSQGKSGAWEGWGETITGYFDSYEAFAESVTALERTKRTTGIYVTLNPVMPALLGRAKNRLIAAGKKVSTTADDDIVSRRRLLIDADPFRPSGISSTQAEMEAAIGKADAVAAYLYGLGFPEFHRGNSGNGAHLVGLIDLPNDKDAKDRVNDFLECLHWKFGTTPSEEGEAKRQFAQGVINVGIDATVFNASRITKLYGTTVRKGDNDTDRPHRTAEFTHIPSQPQVIPAELILQVAQEYRDHKAEKNKPQPPERKTFSVNGHGTGENWCETVEGVERWLAEHSVALGNRDTYTRDGFQHKWDVDCLTCGGAHKDGAAILWGAGKGMGYKCHHNTCKGRGWADVRSIIAPKVYTNGHSKRAPIVETESGPVDSATGEIIESPALGVEDLINAISATVEAAKSAAGSEASRKDLAAATKTAIMGWVLDNVQHLAALNGVELAKVKVALGTHGLAQSWLDRELPNLIRETKPKQTKKLATSDGPRYLVQNGRICQRIAGGQDDSEDAEPVYSPLCNFDARIVANLHLDDGEEIARQLLIAGSVDTGEQLPEITIDAKDFESMQWPVANWGAKAMIEPQRDTKSRLRHAIQTLSLGRLEERHAYTHTGWRVIDGKRVFLHAGGAVGGEGVKVSLPRQMDNYRFPDDHAVDYATAMRESIALMDVAPKRISAPLWAVTFLGPLSEMILPVFVPSMEGGSGSLKSSYTAVFLNHYGAKFSEYAMPADWLATANSLEKLTFHAKDVMLVIDDLRPTTSLNEAKQLNDAVNRIVRAAGNRQGRSRLDSNSDFRRTYAPRGVVAMTAERKAAGLSVNSRIMTINVDPGDINPAMLATAQKQRHVYSYAMRGFIEYVAQNWDELSKVLPDRVAEIRALSDGNGQHKRLPNATAVIYTAFECAMNYAIEIGAITEEAAGRRLDECYQVLAAIAELQNEVTAAEDPALKFVRIISTLIAQDKAYLAGGKSSNAAKAHPLGAPDKGEKIGWHDGFNVFLLPGAYNTVCRYATSEGWSFPSDEATLRKELSRQGYLGKTDGDRFTTKQRVPGEQGKPLSVIAIKYDRMATFLNEMGVTA